MQLSIRLRKAKVFSDNNFRDREVIELDKLVNILLASASLLGVATALKSR